MIELLPDKNKKEDQLFWGKKALFVGLVGAILVSRAYLSNWAGELKVQNENLESRVEELAVRNERLTNQLKKAKKLIDQKDIRDYSKIAADLNLIVPPQVVLEKFEITSTGRVFIEGKAGANKQAVSFFRRLRKHPYFEEVKFISSEFKKEQVVFQLEGGIVNEKR